MRTAIRVLAPAAAAASLLIPLSSAAQADPPYTTPSRVSCESAGLYGNYSPEHGHRDLITTLPRGTRIGHRYTTEDRNSAMVLWYQGKKWGFMLRGCITVGAG